MMQARTNEKVLTRPLFEAELDEIAKIMRVCTVGLSDGLVDKHLAFHETIMIHIDDRFTRGTHFRRYREPGHLGRWYVRMGKRAACKRYLDKCEITFLDGEPVLFQYRLADGGLSHA